MTVRDLMRTDVVTVDPGTTVGDAAAMLRDENVGSVVAVEDGHPVGLVTDRDLTVSVLAEGDDPDAVTVADVMTEDPFTVDADEGVYEVLAAAHDAGVRRVPVVDGEELVGIVTLDDFVVLLASELDNVSAIVQAESPPY